MSPRSGGERAEERPQETERAHEAPRPLTGRSAVVTGGGRGIGRAIAERLAGEGAAVLLAARTVDQVESAAAELRSRGYRATAGRCDVTDPRSVGGLASQAERELGQVDILVNNAGASSSAPLRRLTLEEWNRLLAANATGTFLCTQAFLPGMVERKWGRVVNVASVAGLSGGAYIAGYAAAKHAVVGFTRSVALEVARSGVTVNAVCPGYVDTPMTRASVDRIVETTGRSEEEARAAVLSASPQRRLVTPAEVAHAVASLCHADARSLNGATIVIDGGELAG